MGSEHLLLGLLRDGGNPAAWILQACGVDLAAARAALGRLADRGVVPGPRPSDAELLGTLGIDLEATGRDLEQSCAQALRNATWRPPARDAAGSAGSRGRRCAVRRFSPPGRPGWPAGGPRRSATTRSPRSCCCWGCWRMSGRPGPGACRTRGCDELHASVGLPEGYRRDRAAAGIAGSRPRGAARDAAGPPPDWHSP